MNGLKVLSVASELYPLIKTGGLADVAGALPGALAGQGVHVRSLVPGYPAVLAHLRKPAEIIKLADLFGGAGRLLAAKVEGMDVLVLDAPHLYNRPGNPYSGPDGLDWPDNPFRFAALAWVAAELGRGLVPQMTPDIVHAHDWQAGLTPAYLHYGDGPRPGTVMTVHNLAFQGQCAPELLGALRLPPNSFTMNGVEYYGTIGFLKAGLQLADRITTVSPTYAVEIRGKEAGMGLDGLLRQRGNNVSGILNGIDTGVWNPNGDPYVPVAYERGKFAAPRARNKAHVQERFGLNVTGKAPLFGVVSRLSWQKGLDLLLDAVPALVGGGAQLAILGAGDKALHDGFARAAAAHPGWVGCNFGYDEGLAHLMQAGVDALLVPSRFEPCGLTQLYALRYGCIPVVARVGGLADTVIDANEVALEAGVATGIQFGPVTREALEIAIRRTVDLWHDRTAWRKMQANGMKTEVSWKNPARHYAKLYHDLMA